MGGHEKARECGRCQDKWLTLSAEKERAMAYWWVNHKQTFKSEIVGGYIWSPQRKANGGGKQNHQKICPGEKGGNGGFYLDRPGQKNGGGPARDREEGRTPKICEAGGAAGPQEWCG